MKQFFKFMFASMVGFVLSIVVIFFILVVMVAGFASSFSDDPVTEVQQNTVLKISLDYPIQERTPKNPFEKLDFMGDDAGALGLNDILENIDKAANDDNISGILLDMTMVAGGFSTLEDIRNALLKFKESEKFIYAYSEVYTEGSYYLASVADKVYLNPSGDMMFNGIFADMVFLKGALDKLGIEAQVIKHGSFKSAAESLVQEEMSEENREQISRYVGTMYNHYLDQIGKSRKKTRQELFAIADQLKIRKAEDAVAVGLVDSLAYKDQLYDQLRKEIGLSESSKLKMVSLAKYKNAPGGSGSKYSKDKIAIIYAVGDITGGEGDDQTIGSERLSKAIRKARKDEKVKAIVLRVNSPGGSALASDVIWREMKLAREEKPVIVSMGDVAASGGYYISVAADTIVAQPNTVTGSIGVIAVLMNAQELMNDKLGLKVDGIKFGNYSDLGRGDRPLNDDERQIIQNIIDRIYGDFVSRVAEGRRMDYAAVDSIAQGRVWSGIDAKKLGLVDVLGGMDDAISIAATKAGLEEYRVVEMPEQEDIFEEVFEMFNAKVSNYWMKKQLGEQYRYYQQLESIMHRQGVQAHLGYDLQLN